ncbi:MAG TPA: hypothetical protein VEB40_05835 [Flavipsychrobacter sp.]|nr:hypothetical protein [Flavipsychrobacter sp.]
MSEATQKLKDLLHIIVPSAELHSKWLNSLSMMENTGARKISRYEDPVYTDIIVLKHAAEEARHAYYLKKQIGKIDPAACPDYSFQYLLAPLSSYQYLHRLDVAACRYLAEEVGLRGRDTDHGAYLLVTYAIEVRADSLYGVYQDVLTAHNHRVNVKSIIMEEEGHLEEMTKTLTTFRDDWQTLAERMCAVETGLFNEWVEAVGMEVEKYAVIS